MTSVARFLTVLQNGRLHKQKSVSALFWPMYCPHQFLSQCCQNHQKLLYLHGILVSKGNFSTATILLKKSEPEQKDETVSKKKPHVSKDDKTVQVFDENGLFVGKQKFWKAKTDAAKKNMRLLEMTAKSKKKDKNLETDDEVDSAAIPSYKLVSVDEFVESITDAKSEKTKMDKLRQIVIKSNIDKGGLDIKVNQIKDLLKKKRTLKILIQHPDMNGAHVPTKLVSTLRKVNSELVNISTIQEISNTEKRIIIIATAKDSFLNAETKDSVEENT